MDYDDPRLFDGIRFFLSGFDPIKHQEVKSKIVSKGGVYVAKYPSDCTHVIVHETILDDPICVAARRDKKILVSSLWIDQSIDAGVLVDAYNIMYRPLRDLNGIPGAEGFVICLTGYPRYLREDIMTMTGLMGATFSKALMPTKITHLVCYKFEGEKYDVGKNWQTIKLVNHQWLEDCLKAWKIMPEEHYRISGYELEMMETAVYDSEDEGRDISTRLPDHRAVNEIPIVQKDSGRSLDNPVIPSKLSVPSVQELSKNVGMNEARLPIKPEPVSESRNLHSINKQSSTCQNNDEQYVRKTPVKSGHPSYVLEDLANLSGTRSKRSAVSGTGQSSPKNSNIMPKSSSGYEGKSGNSISLNIKTKEHTEFDAIRNSISELNGAKTASASSGKGLSEVDAEKYSPLSSRRTLRKPSLSLQSEARLAIPEGRLQDETTEKVITGVGACTVESDKISAKDITDAPSNKAVLPDGEGLFTIHQTKQLSGQPDDFCVTPKLQKLITSGSKRIGASDPMTPLNFSHKESNNGSPIRGHTGIETARVSVDGLSTEFPSVKSNGKKHQVDKSNIDLQRSPISGSVASSVVNITKDKPLNKPENASFSPELKKLVASNSGNHALNSDDQIDSLVSNPRRKKMVARKTLGTRPKISKKTAVDQKSSLGGNNIGVNAGLHLADQTNQNDDSNPFVTDEVVASQTGGGDNVLEAKSIQSFVYDINDCAKPSADAKEAEVTYSHSDNTNKQKTPEAKSKGIGQGKQNLVPKKGVSKLAKDNVLSASKEVVEDESGKVCEKKERVKKQTLAATGKKRQGEQLVKEIVCCDGRGAPNDSKSLGTLASKKRRGTLMLNKKDASVEVGQCDAGKQPHRLSGTVKSTKVLSEIANKKDPIAVNNECTDTGAEHTRKKRRGTLLLRKPEDPLSDRSETVPSNNSIVGSDQDGTKGKKLAGKKKRRGTLLLSKAGETTEMDKENVPVSHDHEDTSIGEALKSDLTVKDNSASSDAVNIQSNSTAVKNEPAWFIVSGHRLQRKEFHQVIKLLKGRHCRDSHHWSYQATHFIVPDPIRRTEKFFAAAASGRWILKTDYLTASIQAGKFLPEEPYEWHKNGLTEDGSISLEAPRKWRLLREKTGHGAFYGMNIVVYGECIAPTLGTLKCAVKAGDGTILATCPPYTRFLKSGLDFAIVSPGITRADKWVQEFLKHEIPCVSVDYLVEYVCKPGYSLDRHIQYNTHEWAAKSFSRLLELSTESVADAGTPENQVSDDLACQVCGFTDREEVMLVCGDESGSTGCGVGTHIDCCDPPLEEVPGEDWFCPNCTRSKTQPSESIRQKSVSNKI